MRQLEVRNGKRVVPVCPECGCRLEYTSLDTGRHFYGGIINDARGCKCVLYTAPFEIKSGKVKVFYA
jgi:hypothetical protein